jgi:hypothetical protein
MFLGQSCLEIVLDYIGASALVARRARSRRRGYAAARLWLPDAGRATSPQAPRQATSVGAVERECRHAAPALAG